MSSFVCQKLCNKLLVRQPTSNDSAAPPRAGVTPRTISYPARDPVGIGLWSYMSRPVSIRPPCCGNINWRTVLSSAEHSWVGRQVCSRSLRIKQRQPRPARFAPEKQGGRSSSYLARSQRMISCDKRTTPAPPTQLRRSIYCWEEPGRRFRQVGSEGERYDYLDYHYRPVPTRFGWGAYQKLSEVSASAIASTSVRSILAATTSFLSAPHFVAQYLHVACPCILRNRRHRECSGKNEQYDLRQFHCCFSFPAGVMIKLSSAGGWKGHLFSHVSALSC